MNIFFLHLSPRKCARMHTDKHVIKMILESVQLLSSAHHMTKSCFIPPYKLTHKNHPCSVWVRESKENYKWLVELTKELCKEYTHRYGKIHKSQQYLRELQDNIPNVEKNEFTSPAQAMPVEYKDSNNPVDAYRAYYFFEKHHLHSWKNRKTPRWVIEMSE